MLAALAGALASLPAGIITMRVVEREGSYAVDELCLQADETVADELRDVVERVRGVVVESIRRIDKLPDPLAALELADRLVRGIGPPIETLVDGLPDAITCAWAIAMNLAPDGGLICSSPNAPAVGFTDAPWAPLDGARRLEGGAWMPQHWKMLRFELAAAPLDGARAVIVGRWAGMRFRTTELRQLELLADMATGAGRAPALSFMGAGR